MNKNEVILVDSMDNFLGTMNKMEAHEKARLHRAVSVFIVNSKGEWLIQQRVGHKYHSKNLWSNTCCTHPYPGEDNIIAASRRLMEEMGLSCELRQLFSFTYREKLDNGLTEHEYDHIFFGISDDIPEINKDEVMDFKYVKYTVLHEDIKDNGHQYTVWFKKILENVQQHIDDIMNKK
ncbi:MAG: isopentenyl-diphosphate Delta-isomerase [Bacteroidales bacterium]|nr:isopentenyl-diphosphate Delta-isomerase [Bacteroidales bacterium]